MTVDDLFVRGDLWPGETSTRYVVRNGHDGDYAREVEVVECLSCGALVADHAREKHAAVVHGVAPPSPEPDVVPGSEEDVILRERRSSSPCAASCPLTCDGCWCSSSGACWHHR